METLRRRRGDSCVRRSLAQKVRLAALSLQSRRKHKAWGVSPRIQRTKSSQPARAGDSLNLSELSPALAGSGPKCDLDPGADAPGFMPTPATRVLQSEIWQFLCKPVRRNNRYFCPSPPFSTFPVSSSAFPYFGFAVIMPPLVTTPWTFKACRLPDSSIVKKPIV